MCIISLVLCLCMVCPFAAVGAFAADDGEEELTATFKLEKLEETTEAVSLKLSLTEGRVLCFDAVLKADEEDFECMGITFSDEIKAFFEENTDGELVANAETLMISAVNTVELSTPVSIATFSFKKNESDGITAEDFDVEFTACYCKNDVEGEDELPVVCIVDNAIAQTHTHVSTGDWVKTADATCKKAGTKVKYCGECGEISESQDIDRLPHTEATEHEDANCTNDGYDRVYCSVCGEEISKTIIPKLNHNETGKDVHLASCTEDGYINTVCKLCGDVLETTVLKHQGHKYVRDVKNATCTEDGYIKFVCSVCNDIGNQTTIAHVGHAWGAYKVVKEATYSSKGVERAECSICGAFLEREIPMIVVPVTELVIIPEEDFTLNYNGKDRLQVAVYPEEAIYTAEIVWKSTNPDVVSIDENGNITAKKVGAATIIATTADGTVKASRRITVQYSTLQWIIVYLLFGWLWYL